MTDDIEESSPVEWILASDALALVESHLGGSAAAKLQLADLLADGKIRSRADKLWSSEEDTLNDAWSERNMAEYAEFVEIAGLTWQTSRYWSEDVSLWRWPKNRFVITIEKDPPERTIMEGVRIAAEDVHALIQAPAPFQVLKGRGGRKEKTDEWTAFWLAVVQLAHERRLNVGEFSSQAALRDKLLGMMVEKSLSEDSIKPRVRQIWERFFAETAS